MKRFFGMMPVKEIERTETFEDSNGYEVRIDAGLNGWTVRFGDYSSRYKDESKGTAANFDEAYKVATDISGTLTPLKRKGGVEREY